MLCWLCNSFLIGIVIVMFLGVMVLLIIFFVGYVDWVVKFMILVCYNLEIYLLGDFIILGLGVVIVVVLLMVLGVLVVNIFGCFII